MKFKTSFEDINELASYQNDLVPFLLDASEVYKLASKNYEPMEIKNIENFLLKLYIQFHPNSLQRVKFLLF